MSEEGLPNVPDEVNGIRKSREGEREQASTSGGGGRGWRKRHNTRHCTNGRPDLERGEKK